MRFQQALLLQKQQAEQEVKREEWEKKYKPVYDLINGDYEDARKKHDPIARSLERLGYKSDPSHPPTTSSAAAHHHPATSHSISSASSLLKPLSHLSLSGRGSSHDGRGVNGGPLSVHHPQRPNNSRRQTTIHSQVPRSSNGEGPSLARSQ